jgi:hypothetical protein
MRILLFIAGASLALSSCKLGKIFEPSPERQLGKLLTAHPELAQPDTVTIHDTITVPQVHVETKFVYRTNPVKEQRDSLRLDSLLQKLETHLDTASRRATVREVFHYVRTERPRFPDTLCFDTLGLRGKVWRNGSNYRISLTRQEIRQPHAARAVVTRLKPCDCAALVWYDPRTWPYGWLLVGILLGLTIRFHYTRRRA